jgi:RNA polymerase sigma-70 factor (ECF subfamily)
MGAHAHTYAPEGACPPGGPLEAMVAGMGTGDEIALGSFYDATSHRAFGLALRILRDRTAAEEAVLETYNQAWLQAGRFDARRGNALAWLLTMTRSRAIDLRRSRAIQQLSEIEFDGTLAVEDEAPDPEALAFAGQRAGRVRNAMAQLAAAQRDVIQAAFFEGLSHAEIAARSGVPLGTIKTRIRSGLIALRTLLAEDRESLA